MISDIILTVFHHKILVQLSQIFVAYNEFDKIYHDGLAWPVRCKKRLYHVTMPIITDMSGCKYGYVQKINKHLPLVKLNLS